MADLTNQLQAAAGASTGVASDANFQNTVLLLHGDGTNGAQNNTFIDSSTNNFTITRNGNTTQGTFTPFSKPDGRWGNFFDGNGDKLTLAANAAFVMGSGDFTLEAWVYQTGKTDSYPRVVHFGPYWSDNNAWGINARDNDHPTKITLASFKLGGRVLISSSDFALNTWNHVVVTRASGVFRLFVNGVLEAVNSSFVGTTIESSTTNSVCVGSAIDRSVEEDFLGYVSNARVVKGSVVSDYATSSTTVGATIFTPPTSPLTAVSGTSLLTCQSNRFKDNSSNNFAITRNGDVRVTPFSPFPITTAYSTSVNGGAGYFDGSDWLISDPAGITNAINFGTGDFEISCWCYPTSYATSRAIVDMRAANGPSFGLISLTTTGALDFYDGTSRITSNTAPLNAWNHLVVSRVSGTLKMFINGVEGYSAANTSNYNGTKLTIGTHVATTLSWMLGYIADLRIVKGSGVTSVTVPTAPATVITNTTFLANFTNAGIFDNTGFNALETVGNAQIDTTVKKYGTGSMEFDGNGDALIVYDPSFVNSPGGGDWTFECWVYFNALPANYTALYHLKNDASTSTTVFIVEVTSAGKLSLSTGTALIVDGTSSLLTTGSWIHIAVTRSSGTIRTFINGTQDKSVSNTTTYNGTYDLIGVWRYSGSDFYLNGYIDDLRITKGIARYTTTFTPPTAALPDIGA
jgi:hypothetical protein